MFATRDALLVVMAKPRRSGNTLGRLRPCKDKDYSKIF